MRNYLFYIFIIVGSLTAGAQDDTSLPAGEFKVIAADSVNTAIDANRPARAAFYSAILPGLGQAYNGRYWKVPLVYGALGTSVAVYLYNENQYQELRDAFRIRLAGGTNDAFSDADGNPIISDAGLERAQRTAQRNKELTLLITAGIYILQIIDANVDGHLDDFNVDRNLSLTPTIINIEHVPSGANVGLSLIYNF
ncbi:hypothetical protein JCM19314_244 [Nonlabens ulvanivorans]|uniref:DUF5683 domain-containing protein n=1 Tax=Nonlabens ulvanivorans TaxID=906888 RepID=A0A090QIA4_NONUL|nr:DUF5683 domain-containing protein [Nonlabens ulvanivorans]GAL01963.1 hypothetical protein JCM19314_244 [Nonlabens ulvanivorans]